MDQRDKTVFRQFSLAAVRDGDFGRAFHVHAAIVSREGMAGKIFHRTARFHTANQRTPAVVFEGTVDVYAHRVGRVAPDVFGMVRTIRIFFKIKLVHRVGFCAIRQAGKKRGIVRPI